MILLQFLLYLVLTSLQAQTAPDVKNIFKDKTKIDNPIDLRDPFKPPQMKSEGTEEKQKKGYFSNKPGHYSNIQDQEITNIQDIKLVGVLVGKERRAMVRLKDSGPVVTIKEGMKLGSDQAELKAILPGGIILVEKIINVYGQEEYLETVIPISK